MADLLKALKASKAGKTTDVHPLSDYENFPLVSKLLFGLADLKGEGWEEPPRNMTLFAEGDKLKIVFGAGDNHAKVYATVGGLEKLLEDVEASLAAGDFGLKVPKPEKDRTWRKG